MKHAVRIAFVELHDAEKQLNEALQSEHPYGSSTYYMLGDHAIDCTILGYSGDRVRVRGVETGKEYWVHGARLDGGR